MRFHRLSVLGVASALVLIAGVTVAPPTYAAESTEGLAEQKTHIVKIMKDLKLEPFVGKDKPLCKSFYEDFRQQMNIEYIAPLFYHR
jgi:hypothetical protein